MKIIPNIPSRPPAALNKKNVHEVYCRIMLHSRCFPQLPSSQSPNQARPPSTFHSTLTTPQKQSSILSLERFYTQSNKYDTSAFHGPLVQIFREWEMQNLSDGLRSSVPVKRISPPIMGHERVVRLAAVVPVQ